MKRRGWISVAVLALVAFAAALAFLVLGGGERGGGRARSPTARSGAPELAALPASAPLPPEESAVPAAPPARAPLASSEPAATSAPAGARARTVLVVEAATGHALPGAEVRVLARDDWEPLHFAHQSEGLPILRSDGAGLVSIPFEGEGACFVVARAPGLFGGERLGMAGPEGPDAAPFRLALYPDWDVAVEVVHADGQPAAEIRLSLALPGSIFTEETDAEGRARFEHVGYVCTASGTRAQLEVSLPLATPLFRTLAEAPGEAVRFRLPPLASLALTVLDPERVPVPDGTRLQLGLVRPGEARDVSPFARNTRMRMSATTLAGSAQFEHVEPGLEVELLVQLPGAVAESKHYFAGPARAGERLEHTLTLVLDQPVLEFRVLEAPGRPLAEAELGLRLTTRSSFMRNEHQPAARTDAEGRFRLELPGGSRAGERRTLRVTARSESLGARVELSQPFEPGLVPMGDLLLEPVPLVVAGRVLDGAGAGVAGVALEVQGAVTQDEEGTNFWHWEDLRRELVSGSDGAFALHGLLETKRLRLRASTGKQRSAPVEAEVGQRGVELVLRASGALAGSLLLDPAVPVGELVLVLAPESAELAGSDGSEIAAHERVRPDGSFTLEELVPGAYRFVVRSRESRPLAEVAGVFVIGGEENRDPRLQGLDLRASVFARRITLLFPEPVEDPEGTLRYFASGAEGDQRHHWFRENPFVLLTDLPRFDGVLAVTGYRLARLEGVNGDREVALVPSLRVCLVLPAEAVLPVPPTYVKATLAPLDDEEQTDWGAEVFDERRESRSFVPGPGAMRVVWMLEQRSAGSAMASTFELEPEQRVEVLDVGYEQRFELSVDPAALAEALAKAR